jgi:uncharacterized protein YraI
MIVIIAYLSSLPHLCVMRRCLIPLVTLALAVGITACGSAGASPDPVAESAFIRTPYPTFTPVAVSSDTQQAAPPLQAGTAPETGPSQPSQPLTQAKAVVNTPLVNVRSGPGTDFDVIGMVERGIEFDIIGRNGDSTWWQICCVENQSGWVINEYVDTDGAVDQVVVAVGGAAPPANAPAVPVTPQPPTSDSTRASSGIDRFTLVRQEQFAESGIIRIFAYIYSGNEALAGYSVRVIKDGVELPVTAKSFGGQPAFTWPFQDARQRHQNLKVEFAGVTMAGTWNIQLVDENNAAAGPIATFRLGQNDTQQELYVRYERQ